MVEALKCENEDIGADTIGIVSIYFYVVILILRLLLTFILYFIVIASISPDAIFNGEVYFYPLKITFDGYKRLFDEPYLVRILKYNYLYRVWLFLTYY